MVFGSWLAPGYTRDVGARDFEDVETMLEVTQDHLLLDVGCGPMARGLTYFGKKGVRIVGVDVSCTAVRKAWASVRQLGIGDSVELVVADVEFLPFRSRVFDRVLAVSVLAHLSSKASVLAALREVFRSLRNQGLSYLSWWLNTYSPWSRLLVVGNRLSFVGDTERIQLLSFKGARDVREACRHGGLRVKKVATGSVFWYLFHFSPKRFHSWNQRLMKTLGDLPKPDGRTLLPPFHYDIVAQKTLAATGHAGVF